MLRRERVDRMSEGSQLVDNEEVLCLEDEEQRSEDHNVDVATETRFIFGKGILDLQVRMSRFISP